MSGFFASRQLEFIVLVAIEVATEPTGLATIVGGNSNGDVVDQVICYFETEVGYYDNISTSLIYLYLTFVKI